MLNSQIFLKTVRPLNLKRFYSLYIEGNYLLQEGKNPCKFYVHHLLKQAEKSNNLYLQLMLVPQTLRFLKGLKKNNNKAWFDAHRDQYEAARIDFANFIQLLIDGLQQADTTITGLTARDCMFRINRDIRFSNDKTPYKSNFGASIKRGGRKSPFAGYYFHCEPGNSFIGGGLWMPETANLKNVRQEIDYNWKEFSDILKLKNFKKVYGDLYRGEEISLGSMPRGYDKENEAADYLKLKCFIAEMPLKDADLLKHDLHKRSVEAYKALKPLLDFINRSIDVE